MPVFVGTSGWQYDSWRGELYPPRLAQRQWLECYAAQFQIVEVNNTFYRLPQAGTFEGWRRRTPGDFVFALKLSRYLTHIKRLRDPGEAVDLFVERAAPLQGKMGPLLLQLPPDFRAEPRRLAAALDRFPHAYRIAVEFRHPSWFTSEVRKLLEARNVALCLADRRSRLITPLWQTADWGYLRMHEGRATPRPSYGQGALMSRAREIAELWDDASDVYVFFNNDPLGCAVRNASSFAGAVARLDRTVSRVPAGGANGSYGRGGQESQGTSLRSRSTST